MNIFEFLVYASAIIVFSILGLGILALILAGLMYSIKNLWNYISWGYKYPFSDAATVNKNDTEGRIIAIIVLILLGAVCVFFISLILWNITRLIS